MKIWNQVQTLYATGKTAGTFNEFTEFKLRKGVKNILGFYGVVIDAKPTDGENGIPIFRINSSDLGISNLDLVGAGLVPDGDAATTTNNHQKVWYPWSPKLPANADNVGITFSISAAVSKTEGFAAGIQLVTTDAASVPQDVKDEYRTSSIGTFSFGNTAEEDAGAGNSATYADWGTDDASSIKLTAGAKEWVGVCNEVVPNGFTAEKGLVGAIKYTCSQIPDFPPQEHLLGTHWDAPLGTVIDVAAAANAKYYPMRFPLSVGQINVYVSDIAAQVLTNAADGVAGWVWR